ncbi:MAG: hypothetical protein GX621_04440 [Pirellulaceae bacterium]|nr:hypothetical protein [Pirellulaceae bacterium]
MKWTKWNVATLMSGVVVSVLMASIGAAPAATVLSNVALFQPVTVEFGELSDPAVRPASNLTNDVIDGSAYRITFASELGTLMVDLGGPHDLASFELNFYTATGAKLRAYAPNELGFPSSEQVGTTYTVPNTSNTIPFAPALTDWNGVQYITISDEGAAPNKMVVRELRAYAQVETDPGFIAGVTATATSTYAGLAAMSLCNNGGMTDQRGPVGDPSAMSIPSALFWHSETDVTNAAVTFDLGGPHELSQMLIWNLNQLNWDVRGMQHALIEYSSDGETYTALADANGGEDGNYTIPKVVLDDQLQYTLNPYSLAIDMTGITAKYVRIEGLDTWGSTTNIGLSEVRFYGDAVATQIPGDANNDTFVNEADAKILATYWGATTKPSEEISWWEMGDFNGDEVIDARDAAILAAQWTGSSSESSSPTAVPEPLASSLLLSLMLAVCGLRRNRMSR